MIILLLCMYVCDDVVQSGITESYKNVWGNAEACTLKLYKNVSGITILVENIRVDPILVENISDITESYKNVWVDKQPHLL